MAAKPVMNARGRPFQNVPERLERGWAALAEPSAPTGEAVIVASSMVRTGLRESFFILTSRIAG